MILPRDRPGRRTAADSRIAFERDCAAHHGIANGGHDSSGEDTPESQRAACQVEVVREGLPSARGQIDLRSGGEH